MTNTGNLGTIEATNPVLTVAPLKEDTEMLRATEKLRLSIAASPKRMPTRATVIPSPTKRTSCSDTQKSTASRIQHFLWMTDTAAQTMTVPDFNRCCQKLRRGKWLLCCRKTCPGWVEILP